MKLSRDKSSLLTKIFLLAATLSAVSLCGAIDDQANTGQRSAAGIYVKLQLDAPVKLSKLKAGEVIEGTLSRDVYSATREWLPKGSRVKVVVDHTEKRRRPRNDHWPWAVSVFTPRHQRYPVFQTATVSGASGESTLHVALVSISRKREVTARAKKTAPNRREGTAVETNSNGPARTAPTMVLEAFDRENQIPSSSQESDTPVFDSLRADSLPAGTASKILLLTDVSASKSQPGDAIRAQLIEPVSVNDHVVLPAGTLFEGKVVKKIPPRWGSRAGSLYLAFTGLTLPGGNLIPISASLIGAELDRKSHTQINAEGHLRGEHPGAAWVAINIGVTAGLTKEVDDTTQLVIEAIVSSATDASTAGASRIVASCISAIYMVSRHGRDVVLPRFTEMDIALDRPLSITPISRPEIPSSGPAGN